jgi:threonine/homoserine/homoserine lactone efflux protein
MPGPVTALAVAQGARLGGVAGPLVTAGHAVAEGVLVVVLAVGMGPALRHPRVVGAIGLLGGAVLLGMGVQMLLSASKHPVLPGRPSSAPGIHPVHVVRAGLLATAANPYWLLWWVTVGAAYYARLSAQGVAVVVGLFFAGHLALDLGWNSVLAWVVGAGRGRIHPGLYRAVLVGCGALVVAMSVSFLAAGARAVVR